MKVLSLTQPWATLVAIGAKRFETRSWATNHRGPLAIHAAKGFPRDCKELCFDEPFAEALAEAGVRKVAQLPLGQIIAICDLQGCYRMGSLLVPSTDVLCRMAGVALSPELEFGDFSEGRYAWRLENARKLDEPIPAKGSLGLWEYPL